MATLITITATLLTGWLLYRFGPWECGLVDDLMPTVRYFIGVGGLGIFSLMLDRRRARQWRQQMDHLDAIGKALWRDRAKRRTGS